MSLFFQNVFLAAEHNELGKTGKEIAAEFLRSNVGTILDQCAGGRVTLELDIFAVHQDMS
ncbi:MAG: hypothetical protein IPL22_07480 [Bacteroidetes bacterium]|nr:hypothetical protein [Bacteroidota bacterium]